MLKNHLITLIIKHFTQTNKFFSKNLSQTAQMHAIKIDMNHLKIEEVLFGTKELKIDVLQDKENKHINIKDTGIRMTKAQLISNFDTIKRL
jgi:HSP90 family molecular chaperone